MTLVQTNLSTYTDIFALRGQAYHNAMRQWPMVRTLELSTAIAYADLQQGMTILDMPSGGGYLYPLLPEDCELIEADTAFTVNHAYPTRRLPIIKMDELSLPNDSVDRIISVAGVHHQADRLALYKEWYRVLKGKLALVDVWQNTPTARFLNGFVDAYNPMGHQGDFLTKQDMDDLKQAGFTLTRWAEEAVPWVFPDVEAAFAFTSQLFYLTHCPNVETFEQGVMDCFGVEKQTTGFVIPWTLHYIQAIKA